MATCQRSIFPYVMWFFPLLFFAFQFVLRLWPGLMMQEIMQQFAIDAAGFGLIAAFYYYGYAGMQIPMALLMDRFSPGKIIFLAVLISGLSSFFFIHTDSLWLAILCRFLTGAGSAAGFLGVSKMVSLWFNPKDYSRMIGLSFSIGLLGAVYGGKPLALLMANNGPLVTGNALSLISITLGFIILMVIKEPKNKKVEHPPSFVSNDGVPFVWYRQKTLWLLAGANLLMVGALEGFADIWGVPWLTTITHFSKPDAAFLVSFIFIGMLFGGPLLALLARSFGNYPVIAGTGVGISLIFFILLTGKIESELVYGVFFFLIGILCCYQVLVFAAGTELVPEAYLGLTVALLNSINMLGGSFFHTMIGWMMAHLTPADLIEKHIYTTTAFHKALTIIPICALSGAFLIFGIMASSKKNKLTQ